MFREDDLLIVHEHQVLVENHRFMAPKARTDGPILMNPVHGLSIPPPELEPTVLQFRSLLR